MVLKWSGSKKMKDKSKESSTAPVIISEIWIKTSSMLRAMLTDVWKSREIKPKECFHFTVSYIKLLRVKLNWLNMKNKFLKNKPHSLLIDCKTRRITLMSLLKNSAICQLEICQRLINKDWDLAVVIWPNSVNFHWLMLFFNWSIYLIPKFMKTLKNPSWKNTILKLMVFHKKFSFQV